MVFGVDDAVFNLVNGEIGGHGIQKLPFMLLSAWPHLFRPLLLLPGLYFLSRFLFFRRPLADNSYNLRHHGRFLVLGLVLFTDGFSDRLLLFYRFFGRFLFRNHADDTAVFEPFEKSEDEGRQALA